MKITRFLIISLVVLAAAGVSAEGRGDAAWLKAQAGVINAWKTDFPVMDGVSDVKLSKKHASLMYVAGTKNAPETVQAIATFYKGKTIGKFTVGDFTPRDDFMPDSQGFSAGKKQQGKGLSIFIIPQGSDVLVYIHPFKK